MFRKYLLEQIEAKLGKKEITQHIANIPNTTANEYDSFFAKLKPSKLNLSALDAYTKGSKFLNKALWAMKNGTINNLTDNHIKMSNDLNEMLNSHSNDEDFTVYTGIRRCPQELSAKTDKIIHFPNYISASHDPRVALNFARKTDQSVNKANGEKITVPVRNIIKITVRKGQKIGAYIAPHSKYENEREFLIKNNTLLHIHPHYEEYIDSKDGNINSITRIHHAIILHPAEYSTMLDHPEVKSSMEMKSKIKIGN